VNHNSPENEDNERKVLADPFSGCENCVNEVSEGKSLIGEDSKGKESYVRLSIFQEERKEDIEKVSQMKYLMKRDLQYEKRLLCNM